MKVRNALECNPAWGIAVFQRRHNTSGLSAMRPSSTKETLSQNGGFGVNGPEAPDFAPSSSINLRDSSGLDVGEIRGLLAPRALSTRPSLTSQAAPAKGSAGVEIIHAVNRK